MLSLGEVSFRKFAHFLALFPSVKKALLGNSDFDRKRSIIFGLLLRERRISAGLQFKFVKHEVSDRA